MGSGDRKRYSSSNNPSSSKKQRDVSTEETEDRISQLPEPLLVQILSFSRTKDAFSTRLVSKSWFSLWTFVDCFDFTTRDFLKPENAIGSFVEYALAHSVSPNIKLLKLNLDGLDNLDDWQISSVESLVDRCVSFAVEKNVENVVILGDLENVPRSLYTCLSLITLVLSGLSIKFHGVIEWKSLKSLKLEWSSISDKDIVNLLAGCPALETIEFCMVKGFHHLEIKSLKLKRLIFAGHWHASNEQPLEISAPYLQHLEISGDLQDLKCRLVDASSLVYAKLTFGITCIKDIFDDEDSDEEDSGHDEEDSCHDYHQAFWILIRDNLQKLSNVTRLIIGAWFTDALCMMQLKGVPIPELKCNYLMLESHIQKLNLCGVAGLLQASPYVETLNINLEIRCYDVSQSHCLLGLAPRDDIDLLSEISSFVFPKIKRVTIVMSFKFCEMDHLKRSFDKLFKLLEFLLKTTMGLEELVIMSKMQWEWGWLTWTEYLRTMYLQKLAEKLLDCQRSSSNSVIIFKE